MKNVAPDAVDATTFERRQKRLLVIAWGATLLPLIAFGYLTWQASLLDARLEESKRELDGLAAKKLELEKAITSLGSTLEAQRNSTKHYRDFAGIQIRFYRESDRAVVQRALDKLGFKIDTRLGSSALIDGKPNTIAFGNLVSSQDLQDIAVALVEAGFPLKRIAPAIRQPDPQLVQIYASAESERSCGLLAVEQVRSGLQCGPLSR